MPCVIECNALILIPSSLSPKRKADFFWWGEVGDESDFRSIGSIGFPCTRGEFAWSWRGFVGVDSRTGSDSLTGCFTGVSCLLFPQAQSSRIPRSHLSLPQPQ